MTAPFVLSHLSFSQADTWSKCQMRWFFRYIEGRKTRPNGVNTLGSSGHKAHEFNFDQKIKSHKDLSKTDVLDYFDNDFEGRKKNDNVAWFKDKSGELKDTGAKALTAYYPKYSQSIQPEAVEEKHIVDLGDGLKFVVIMDNRTKHRVIDYKFSAKKLSDTEVHQSNQATANLIGNKLGIADGVDRSFRFDCLVKTKNPYIYQPETTRTQADMDRYIVWLKKIAAAINAAVKSGIFLENTNGWWCTPKWCGYFDLCKPYQERVIRA